MLNVLLLVPVFLFSLCVHEFAHAWVATKRGDPTPRDLGRLTLQPWAHADLIGTILLPVLCIYYGMPFFGWAKPVPVDPRHMKYGRRDMALVAAAGPLSNVLLAVISALWLGALVRIPGLVSISLMETLQTFAVVSIQVNLMLALFNMIPIPPLDGFMVVQGFLSSRAAHRMMQLAPAANFVLLALLLTGGLRVLAVPAQFAFAWLIRFVT